MSMYVRPDECFNVALTVFSDGSYFGDSDIINQKQGIRAYTAICQTNCQMYSLPIG